MPAYRIGRFGWLPDPFDHRDLKFTDKPVKAALAKSAARKGSKIKKAKPSMTITVLNEQQRSCFKGAAKKVEAKFIEMTGDSGKKILSQMKADLKATE